MFPPKNRQELVFDTSRLAHGTLLGGLQSAFAIVQDMGGTFTRPVVKHVLISGDTEGLDRLSVLLRAEDVECSSAASISALLGALTAPNSFDVVIAPLSQFQAEPKLQQVQQRRIALVAPSELSWAVEALGEIVDDCIFTPIKANELLVALARPKAMRAQPTEATEEIVGTDAGLADAWRVLGKAARFDADVLLCGESGTGKELFAQAQHRLGTRSGACFVACNCAAIPEGLLESELFGHRQGAFTDAHQDKLGVFARADGGTLFLDEIGDFPLTLQAKLLRALHGEIQPLGAAHTQKVDVRVVSATSRDLKAMVASGEFREDLYYRLAVVPIVLPPLRDRKEDIEPLVEHFMESLCRKHKLDLRLSSEALALLKDSSWPGNVRQLQNFMERLLVLCEGPVIDAALVRSEAGITNTKTTHTTPLGDRPLKKALQEIEARLISEALEACAGKRAKCSELLGISPRALLYKIKDYGL